jgi:deoxyribodipyrimidine photo-lyase
VAKLLFNHLFTLYPIAVLDKRRETQLLRQEGSGGPVIYIMSRELRVHQNWGLQFAKDKADELKSELYVVFEVLKKYQAQPDRNFAHVVSGLQSVARSLYDLNIHFKVLTQDTEENLEKFLHTTRPSHVYVDFSPLKGPRARVTSLKTFPIQLHEVDSHNIVPCRYVSIKQEYSAHTFRLKYAKVLDDFLTPFPKANKHLYNTAVKLWTTFPKVEVVHADEQVAKELLAAFLERGLETYAQDRNDPVKDGTSKLSLYLHFGMLSSQYVLSQVVKTHASSASKAAFSEQLTIRKELSDNYCFYNQKYDSYQGFPDWGIKTLTKHLSDKRDFIYNLEEFETGATHDSLWNACQHELVRRGRLHGYLRMYWAKKILEWTRDFKDSHAIAVLLNDKYQLDGRDPNGYVGISWSLGGLHDRPWFEKPIFGLVRTMTRSGAEKKFDVEQYIKTQAHY